MRYLSICSGIEAATVAAHPLGWEPAAFAEIEPFPSAVLAHHYPTVPNLGDFTAIEAHHVGAIDLLVGGTPCQAFSVAGKRIGLDDPRGNLTLEFLALAGRLRPRWVVWENVPGVLSIDGGRTFGAILGALGQLGYGFAYRVLDAQHFGVPQRRRRVFVVGCAGGNWQRAAAVLFERAGLCGDSAASGEAGKDVAAYACGGLGSYSEGCGTLRSHGGDLGGGYETLVAHTLRGEGHDASEDGTGRGVPLVAVSLLAKPGTRHNASDETLIAFGWQNSAQQGDSCGNVSPSLDKSKTPAVFDGAQITSAANRSRVTPGAASPTLSKGSAMHAIASGARRLTPTECERLQGFPDHYTDVPYRGKPAADGPRYKAIGNSMAVPVMRWIFERIAMVDAA